MMIVGVDSAASRTTLGMNGETRHRCVTGVPPVMTERPVGRVDTRSWLNTRANGGTELG